MNQPFQLQKNKITVLMNFSNIFFHTYLDNLDKFTNKFEFLVLNTFEFKQLHSFINF